ncbi:hypothetical protein DPSP01_005951 [Paraphaeosphaeria sporulosa]|uniref:BZIP domain-containing protein n=1 Tax=Paraphaeosphaeria sporulosa TaxID=1460663 RepID=A0A177C8S0_9PLEO|nr:uncharacterized protein CC84DRAFT_1197628 [Paraphaeosphaeria sporulosa]OAG04144.1 hypothetical protein CC84DRAFT_1197628 [Paraphaeosphaeria sporulosa]
MDSQSYDAWWSQGNYSMPPHQTTIFELPPDLSKVPSLSGSPVSSTYDQFPGALPQEYYPQIAGEAMHFGNYQIPMTPPEFSSDHDSPYCSPRPPPSVEPVYSHTQMSQQMGQLSAPTERQHTTSGRRRAQNRAAQRAFRERKEKHARDLEIQLAALNEKYSKLETSHTELNAAYEKLRKTIELLTQDDDADGDEEEGKLSRRRSSNPETLRKLLEIIHGDFKGVAVKNENP